MSRLTVIGTVVCEDIETPSGTSSSPPGLGGSCIYASVAAQLLHPVDLIGVVGADFPIRYLNRLQSLNIDLTGLERSTGKTFYWKAKYARDLLTRDTLALDLGVYKDYHPQIPEKCRGSEYALIANLMPQIQEEALAQLDSPNIVVLGTIDHWIRTTSSFLISLLPRVDGFLANEEEMKLLSGLSDPIAAAKYVATLGSKFCVVTLAERGSVLVMGEREFHFPAFPYVVVRDPTGAGDSFAGGLLACLARDHTTKLTEQSLCKAMLYGTVLASFCVETFSIEKLCLTQPEEMEERIDFLRQMVDFPC